MKDRPSERLSVTTARQHVEGGHGGKFEAYCYRCQYFDELQNSAIWELAAIERRRIWLYPRGSWTGRIGFGDDEYQRRTVYFGRLVIALWRCRCEDCEERRRWLRSLADGNPGQEDRDKQRPNRNAGVAS